MTLENLCVLQPAFFFLTVSTETVEESNRTTQSYL